MYETNLFQHSSSAQQASCLDARLKADRRCTQRPVYDFTAAESESSASLVLLKPGVCDSVIEVKAVTQACCQAVLHSSTEQVLLGTSATVCKIGQPVSRWRIRQTGN